MKKRTRSTVISVRGRRAEPAGPTKGTVGLRESERGIAMILTLAILVMVTLLVVAFAVSMRVENTASKNFNDLIKARQIAQAAVDQAVATIRDATPPITNAPTLATYVTAPGVVYQLVNGVWTTHSMSTPFPTVQNAGSVDLNQGSLITGIGNPEFGVSQLWVGWSNIVVNINGAPEVVGRFAYWVDDESAKVNLNVAGSRGYGLEGYTPGAIDLPSLHFSSGPILPTDVDNITNYVSKVRPFDTIQSMELTNVPTTTYSNNQFYVTANSISPDLTPWGSKRLNLSNVVANIVPGNLASQNAAINQIVAALSDLNLATWFGGTFANKYPNLQQIAANIIDYIDTDPNPTDSGSQADLTPPAYLGLEQTPYLNEISIATTVGGGVNDPVNSIYPVLFTTSDKAELWYMYTNAVPAVWSPPAGSQIVFLARPAITVIPSNSAAINGLSSLTLGLPAQATMPVTIGNINPGLTRSYTLPGSESVTSTVNGATTFIMTSNLATLVFNSGIVTAIFRNASGRIDYAEIPVTNYTVVFDANSLPITVTWASACNDPRVKPVSNTWIPVGDLMANAATIFPSALNPSPGVLNTTVVTTNGLIVVPGDGDTSCHVVSGSGAGPGTSSRDRGTMTPGELSFIHTGIPWRTFSLQPQATGESSPPDWALLDLFSATDTTNVVGRMNINSAISLPTVLPFPVRSFPLTALLTNTFSIAGGGTLQNSYAQATAVNNVYTYPTAPVSHVVSPTGSGPVPFCPNAFTMVGEIANTQSLSDTQVGVSPTGTSKSNRETPVRGTANLITTRSDTFTVWVIAQSIRDLNKNGAFDPGTDLITGEVKVQAIVQRYVDYTVFPPQPYFRTLYYRYLYN